MNGTVLFAWRRTPPPFFIGGAEISQRLLARELAASRQVVYLGSHHSPWGTNELPGMLNHLRAAGIPFEHDPATELLRYTWDRVECIAAPQRAIVRTLRSLVDSLQPALVIASQEGSGDLIDSVRSRTRTAAWIHSVSATGLSALTGRPEHVLATSKFTATRVPGHSGRTHVLYPPFAEPGKAATPTVGDLLMINPIPAKGAAIVHELIQRLPERHFTLVEGWWNTADKFTAHPNVTYLPRQPDLGSLYAGHRLLLVPSQCEDAYPRVIIEAALHGLPALGSKTGGIPEAITDPGRLIDPGDVTAWEQAVNETTRLPRANLSARAAADAAHLMGPRLPQLIADGVLPD